MSNQERARKGNSYGIKLEHSTLMEEYKALREEIKSLLDAARQTLNISMAGIGLLVAGAPLIIQAQIPSLFLVSSIFLYFIALAQMRYLLLAIRQGEYLKREIFPYIRKTLNDMSDKRNSSPVLNWEASVASRPRSLFLLPVTSSDYIIPLGAALFSSGTYFYTTTQHSHQISVMDWLLVIINVLMFLYCAYVRV